MKVTDEVYREYSQMVYMYLFSLTGDAHVAEEVTQETFYQAVKSIGSFKGESSVSTWLIGIANNVLRGYFRKQKKQAEEELPKTEIAARGGTSTEDIVLRSMDTISLMQAMHRLPEPYREVLHLRLTADLSFKELGQIMERTENWARVTYYRGKEKLLKGVEIE
mgnify:CR=1 FL=1